MIDEDFQIVRLDEGVFGSIAEEIVRMANDELIERRRRRHQHRARASAAASGAAGALPGGGDGAGVTGHDDGVERTDVNAELESAGGNHSANYSIAEAAFDFAALVRQVAAAIAANGFRFSRQVRIRLLQIGQENFSLQARIGEDDGLQIVFQKFLGHARGFVDVAAADAQSAIHNGWIVKDESFFRGRSAIGTEDFNNFGFKKSFSEIAGVGDGGGTTDELGIAAVKAGDAAEAAEDIAQVAAEDAAVGMQFIEDDVAEVFEEASPARMVREDAGVQHVWIGQNDVTFFANGFASVGGRVAVVSENAEAVFQTPVEVVEFGELVLREGLGGEEVECAGAGIFEDRVQNWHVIAQRFSGGGGRHDDDIFSGVDRFRCGGLVGVQAADAFGGVGGGEFGMHPGREVRPLGLARRKMTNCGEDFAFVVASSKGVEDFVDAGDCMRRFSSTNS